MSLGMEIDLGLSDILLGGDPAPAWKGAQQSHFLALVCCGQMVAHLSNCWPLVKQKPRSRTHGVG